MNCFLLEYYCMPPQIDGLLTTYRLSHSSTYALSIRIPCKLISLYDIQPCTAISAPFGLPSPNYSLAENP